MRSLIQIGLGELNETRRASTVASVFQLDLGGIFGSSVLPTSVSVAIECTVVVRNFLERGTIIAGCDKDIFELLMLERGAVHVVRCDAGVNKIDKLAYERGNRRPIAVDIYLRMFGDLFQVQLLVILESLHIRFMVPL